MTRYRIERAVPGQAETVATMVAALLKELSGGAQQLQTADLLPVARARLEQQASFFAWLAIDADESVVGVITASAGTAIYAGGTLGTIQELYVLPPHRSAGIGQMLLDAVLETARREGWNRVEVGAPSATRWQRTIDFYKANGFVEIGPRLQRRLTS